MAVLDALSQDSDGVTVREARGQGWQCSPSAHDLGVWTVDPSSRDLRATVKTLG